MILSYENMVGDRPSIREALIMSGVATAPIVSMLKTKKIGNFVHAWLNDKYADPKENANLEVTGVGETPKDTKQKTTNVCQILKSEVKVSWRKQDINQYVGDELNRQVAKVGKEHIKDLEFALLGLNHNDVFAKYVDMSDTAAAKMAGFWYFIPNDNQKDFGGTDFTLEQLHEIIQPVWEKGGVDDGKFKIFMGAGLKAKVNKWIEANSSLRVKVDNNTIDPRVTRIVTDFGEVDVVLHRLFQNDKLKDKVLCGNFSDSHICYLHDTKLEEVSTDETATIKRFYTDATLEVGNAYYFASGKGLQ